MLERAAPVTYADQVSAMTRGGVVLLSSHLEGFAKKLVELAVERIFDKQICMSKLPARFIYYSSQDLISNIVDSQHPDTIAKNLLALQSRDGKQIKSSGPLVAPIDFEVFERGFSTPKYKPIDKFLKRVGYNSLLGDLKARQRGQFQIIKNSVENLVDTRNAIAHGDSAEKRTPSELQSHIDFVKIFCRDTDVVFCDWYGANVCPLR
ncbi:MAG: hypothetical protein GW757_13765 [Alphaproteobacteria bacterium]|nr:hypothetical protein [Alphaproteobacteria bacterium]